MGLLPFTCGPVPHIFWFWQLASELTWQSARFFLCPGCPTLGVTVLERWQIRWTAQIAPCSRSTCILLRTSNVRYALLRLITIDGSIVCAHLSTHLHVLILSFMKRTIQLTKLDTWSFTNLSRLFVCHLHTIRLVSESSLVLGTCRCLRCKAVALYSQLKHI